MQIVKNTKIKTNDLKQSKCNGTTKGTVNRNPIQFIRKWLNVEFSLEHLHEHADLALSLDKRIHCNINSNKNTN